MLKIGQNLKFDLQIFALRGIELAPHDDTMLMSYVLDAGRYGHGIDAAGASATSITRRSISTRSPGRANRSVAFDCVDDRQGAPNMPPRTPT